MLIILSAKGEYQETHELLKKGHYVDHSVGALFSAAFHAVFLTCPVLPLRSEKTEYHELFPCRIPGTISLLLISLGVIGRKTGSVITCV